jgi:hypothetical protein
VIYDATLMMFERKRDDFFRHKVLGLGFLDYLRRDLKLSFLPSGTGDLVFRLGGTQGPGYLLAQRVGRAAEAGEARARAGRTRGGIWIGPS